MVDQQPATQQDVVNLMWTIYIIVGILVVVFLLKVESLETTVQTLQQLHE